MEEDDHVSLFKSDSLNSSDAPDKVDRQRPANVVDSEDQGDGNEGEEFPMLNNNSNIYTDSPRTGIVEEYITEQEIRRRRQVGYLTLFGVFVAILISVLLLHFLSHHEAFRYVAPLVHCCYRS